MSTDENTSPTTATPTLAEALRRTGAPTDYVERLTRPIKIDYDDETVEGVEGLLGHAWWVLRQVQAEEALVDRFEDVWVTVAGHVVHHSVERVGLGNAEAVARWYYDHVIRDDKEEAARDLDALDFDDLD